MGRPRRQEPRRAQLIAATQRVIARDGLVGLRVREIAAEAQMSPASVLYYYPDSFQLAIEAMNLSVREMSTERAAVAASVPDPHARLLALLDLELSEPVTPMWRAVTEIPGQIGQHPALAEVLRELISDQTHAFGAAIADGVRSQVFHTTGDATAVARAIVSLTQCANTARFCQMETLEESRARVIGAAEILVGLHAPASAPASAPTAGARLAPPSTAPALVSYPPLGATSTR